MKAIGWQFYINTTPKPRPEASTSTTNSLEKSGSDENPETGQIQAKGPSGEGQRPRVEKDEGPEVEILARLLIVAEGPD